MIETAGISCRAGENSTTALIDGTETYVAVCAWCGMTRDDGGKWSFSMVDRPEHATHGICPACLTIMYRELKIYRMKHASVR